MIPFDLTKKRTATMVQNGYSRFSLTEREILFKLLAEGKKQKDIATELGRNPSTVSREIRRNGMTKRTYRPSHAEKHVLIESRKRRRKYKLVENQELAKIVEDKLKSKWSPEQISGKLKSLFLDPCRHISHETIYRYIYSIKDKEHRESLVNSLRQSRKRRRPRRKQGSKKRSTIKDFDTSTSG
jgi:IS30 family transposase